jgi:hypothetical protein
MDDVCIGACGLTLLVLIFGCARSPSPPASENEPVTLAVPDEPEAAGGPTPSAASEVAPKRNHKLVHVIVVLADNEHQGIVRIPADLGNGQNPRTNLYWGAMYGVRTFLPKTGHWRRTSTTSPPEGMILERCVFESTDGPRVRIVAEAWDGRAMRPALEKFFGEVAECEADLLCFVGHNGLMDVSLDIRRVHTALTPQTIVLACKSKPYFEQALRGLGSDPLVVTTGLMAPEAYTLDAAIRAWAAGRDRVAVRRAAATAYAQYQRCSIAAARRLFDVP